MPSTLDYVGDRFDAIVVDGGQDFLESWWVPLECCFSDTADGILYVFHDDNQQVYHRVPTFPAELQEMVLDENLRNTQRIHEATSRFYRGEPFHAVGPEGREVEIIPVASQDEIGAEVGKVLHRLIAKEHLTASDIAVLVGASHGSPFKKDDQIGNVAVTRDQTTEPGKVLLESVRRFKGLERKVVVLTGIDDLTPEDEKSLLYVGLSRARVYLVVVATAATLGRLGLGAAVAPG